MNILASLAKGAFCNHNNSQINPELTTKNNAPSPKPCTEVAMPLAELPGNFK